MGIRKKTLDIMNSSLKIFTTLLVIVFVLYPLSVFGKALYNNGQINLSEFLFLKDEFYLVKIPSYLQLLQPYYLPYLPWP